MKRHHNTTSEVLEAALKPNHHDGFWISAAEKTKRRSPRVSSGGRARVNAGGRSDRAGPLPRPARPGIPITKQQLRLSSVPLKQPQLCFMDPKSSAAQQATQQESARKRNDWLGYAFMGAMFACTFLV
ncbi:MAG: hypothetical protein ACI8QC_001304 [Planctomycetota bacterium]|jgi:hypothetical protein